MAVFEVPLIASPQSFAVTLAGVEYRLRVVYADADEGGWILDISDSTGTALVCGIPLVTGLDLLAQYPHLGIGGQLYVVTSGDANAVPTYENLGSTCKLYFEVV